MSTKSARAFKRKGRGSDATGRSKRGPSFVMLHRHMLESEAYRSLKPAARALYTELKRRYYGLNNGKIGCSVRDASSKLHISKDTAAKAFQELMEKGFVKARRPGSFHWKVPHASEWILTEEDFNGETATKEFMRWRASQEKTRSPHKDSQSQSEDSTSSE